MTCDFQGKSLSLICGALTWLKDFEEKERQEAVRLLGLTVSASAGDSILFDSSILVESTP